MIRSLRSAHRVVFLVAAVILPVLLVEGLRARRPLPLAAAVALPSAAPASPPLTWSTSAGSAIVTLVRAGTDSNALDVQLSPATAFRGPDLLLYWTSRSLPVDDVARLDVLLGAVSGQPARRFRLPPDVRPGHGSLLLFSLAHNNVVGAMALPPESDGGR